MIKDNELIKREVYYYKTTDADLVTEYRFFKCKAGWHFLVTTSRNNSNISTVELTIPKELIPTIIIEKLDEDFDD